MGKYLRLESADSILHQPQWRIIPLDELHSVECIIYVLNETYEAFALADTHVVFTGGWFPAGIAECSGCTGSFR